MRQQMRRIPAFLLAATLALWFGSCDPLTLGDSGTSYFMSDPIVKVGQLELTENPSFSELASYYCPQLYDTLLVEEACQLALGTAPLLEDLRFRFVLPLDVENPNDFPLPAVELLTILSVFHGEQAEELSAVCVSFCDATDATCNPYQDGACESDDPDILTMDDFAQTALDFLTLYISQAITGAVPPELKVKTIPARGRGTVFISFEIAPEAVLDVLEQLFLDQIDDVVAGDSFAISIPYRIEGTVWFHVENFGRFGIQYGPVESDWNL